MKKDNAFIQRSTGRGLASPPGDMRAAPEAGDRSIEAFV